MRGSKPRIWVAVLVLAIVGSSAPAATAAWRSMQRTSTLNSDEYLAANGRWELMDYNSPVRAVHAAVLPSGKVWLAAGSGNNTFDFNAGTYKSVVWNPADGTFKDVNTPWDLFCSGTAYLADGNILVVGGTSGYEDLERNRPYKGLNDTFIFNTQTEEYERVGSMNAARWYPTAITLGNGNVLTAGGLDHNGHQVRGEPTIEVYDAARKRWYLRDDLKQNYSTYPHLTVMADGRLFYSGADAGFRGNDEEGSAMWSLDVTNDYQLVPGLVDPEAREYPVNVLLPPAQRQRLLIAGGGPPGGQPTDPSTASTMTVDLTLAQPTWQAGPDLPTAKRYISSVLMPDGKIFASGGSELYRTDDVLESHIYDPTTNTFTEVATPTVGRNYHSNLLLLPDGSIASVGSNPLKDNFFEMRIERYYPPYFFQGTRPAIVAGPSQAAYDEVIQVQATSEAPIKAFSLIRATSTTHQLNTDQRLVNVPFEDNEDGTYDLRIEANPNVAVPGPYMLFALDEQGRPSQAHWVLVGHQGGQPATSPGSTLADGSRPIDPDGFDFPPKDLTPAEIQQGVDQFQADPALVALAEADRAEAAGVPAPPLAEAPGAGDAPGGVDGEPELVDPGAAPDGPVVPAPQVNPVVPDDGAVAPDEGAVAPDEGAVAPDEGAVVPEDDAVVDDGAVVPDEDAAAGGGGPGVGPGGAGPPGQAPRRAEDDPARRRRRRPGPPGGRGALRRPRARTRARRPGCVPRPGSRSGA